jgi:hypothetical protein
MLVVGLLLVALAIGGVLFVIDECLNPTRF